MKRLLALLVLLLAACSAPKVNYDCKAHVGDFSGYYEEKGFLNWCNDCVKTGMPSIDYDAGPFCNTITSDAGESCTDKAQCQGYCVTSGALQTSGSCSPMEKLESGCHWVLQDGQATELCVA